MNKRRRQLTAQKYGHLAGAVCEVGRQHQDAFESAVHRPSIIASRSLRDTRTRAPSLTIGSCPRRANSYAALVEIPRREAACGMVSVKDAPSMGGVMTGVSVRRLS